MFNPSPYQQQIFNTVVGTNHNIVIEATAGSGKTTTIVEASKLISPHKRIIFLAFNKSIAEELSTRLPQYVECSTIHSMGMRILSRHFGGVQLNEYKSLNFIDKVAKEKADFIKEKRTFQWNTFNLINLYRLTLAEKDPDVLEELADKHDISFEDKAQLDFTIDIVDSMSAYNRRFGAHKPQIDFTDMIYLPITLKNIHLPKYDVVFVDECFPYDQYISTIKGKIKIGVLEKKFSNGEKLPMVCSFNERNGIFENKNIKKVWCSGKRKIFEVVLNGKRKIKSTKNHKYLTNNGWKRLDELNIGDAILSNYKSQPYHMIMSDLQRDVFIGTSLGDSHLDKISYGIYRIRCIHGKSQKEYIDFKSNFFNKDLEKVVNNGYSKNEAYRFQSNGVYWGYDVSKEDMIDLINERSLAILYMDDGNILKNELGSRLYSLSNNKYLVSKLRLSILNKFGINSKVCESRSSSTNRKYYYLSFNKENTIKLSKLVAKYIHPIMSYKILDNHKKYIDLNNWNYEDLPYGCMVVTKEMEYVKEDFVYDIEVEDNHNFIITSSTYDKNIKAKDYGLIAHNCQDLNAAQRTFIEKIVSPRGRLIAVGDPCQAIYSFMGADMDSFKKLKERSNTVTLPLSVSYRCGKNIVNHARQVYDIIEAYDENPDGIVRQGDIEEINEGDMVLCRNNRPLVALYLQLIQEQKKCCILGKDIGKNLLNLLNKIKGKSKRKGIKKLYEDLKKIEKKLADKGVRKPKEHKRYISQYEKVRVIELISEHCDSVAEIVALIRDMFSDDKEGIVLSTIHKSKGLEADRVFIIRRDLMPSQYAVQPWQMIQEDNLKFVAFTRAKNELVFVDSWTDDGREF